MDGGGGDNRAFDLRQRPNVNHQDVLDNSDVKIRGEGSDNSSTE